MKTENNKTAKTSEKNNVLDSLVKKIETVNVAIYKANTGTKKELYRYPEYIKADEKARKTFRVQKRKEKTNICNNLIIAVQAKNETEIEKIVLSFEKFYAENFLVNDFSVESFTSVNEQNKPQLKNLYSVCLQYVKAYKAK